MVHNATFHRRTEKRFSFWSQDFWTTNILSLMLQWATLNKDIEEWIVLSGTRRRYKNKSSVWRLEHQSCNARINYSPIFFSDCYIINQDIFFLQRQEREKYQDLHFTIKPLLFSSPDRFSFPKSQSCTILILYKGKGFCKRANLGKDMDYYRVKSG